MKAYLPEYNLIKPKNLKELLGIINENPSKYMPLAGGTDLMVQFESGNLKHKEFIDISKIKEFSGIKVSKDYLTIGSLTTFTEIINNKYIAKNFPLLVKAAVETGSIGIQNRGTIGGNIGNASPAADTPPILLVYDALIELISKDGSRVLPYRGFHIGYKKTLLKSNEFIYKIHIPIKQRYKYEYFRKVGTRKAMIISKVVLVAGLNLNKDKLVKDVKIAYGSLAPTVVRAHKVEEHLINVKINDKIINEAMDILKNEIKPIDDIRSTSNYRLKVAENLLKEFLKSIKV